MRTVKYGGESVEVWERGWKAVSGRPYPTTFSMKPGDRWQDMPASDQFQETFAELDGEILPVGAAICRELLSEGANWALFTEQFAGSFVLIDADLICVSESGPHAALISQLRLANGGRYGGFPDVIAEFPDGRVVLCEAKAKSTKDSLRANQHDFARAARTALGSRLELAVVLWG